VQFVATHRCVSFDLAWSIRSSSESMEGSPFDRVTAYGVVVDMQGYRIVHGKEAASRRLRSVRRIDGRR
jgi:hypothetical protein